MKNNQELYVTTVQDRELAACAPFMEVPTHKDIRTDNVLNPEDECKIVSTVYTFTTVERITAFNWLKNNGFRPVLDAEKLMF